METQLIIEGLGTINVSSEYIGDKQSPWSKDNYHNHLIEVSLSDDFKTHGSYTVSNSGGYLIELSDCGGSARVRDSFGSDNPKTSDWFEIEYIPNEDGDLDDEGNIELVPVINPEGYNIPLNMVMRIEQINHDDVKSLEFEYWASISHPEIQSEEDLISALKCCISDGISGLLDFEDFCSEFGYNSDSISDKKVYDSCVELSQKLLYVFGSEDRIEEIHLFLNENFDL